MTNVLTEGTFRLEIASYKTYKLLPTRANLRDHMTPLELVLTSLSEATTISLHHSCDSWGFLHWSGMRPMLERQQARRVKSSKQISVNLSSALKSICIWKNLEVEGKSLKDRFPAHCQQNAPVSNKSRHPISASKTRSPRYLMRKYLNRNDLSCLT